MSKHITYVEALRSASRKHWGKNFESVDEAEREIVKQMSAVDIAGLDFVRRLSVMIDALVRDGEDSRSRERECNNEVKPENAKAFPGIKVGDFLYHGDLEEGIYRHVVVSVTDGGFARLVYADLDDYGYHKIGWACNFHFTSLAEAVACEAKSEIAYHSPRLRYAEAALEAAESGKSVDAYLDPMPEECGSQ